MIRYIKGDLLSSTAEALVNTVNTVGVMGKGIALQFKTRFPQNYRVYNEACKKGTFKTGQVLVVREGDLLHQKTIINFPTKAHWKGDSKYEYISSGLEALKVAIIENNIKSIAIPPLGCGNGGLDWNRVKVMIEEALKVVNCDITVYTPNNEIKAILQKETPIKEVKLTPARAMLIYLLFQYEASGEQSSLFVANKLAYFLQRRGENLRLKFEAHHYGPYTVQLNHVLTHLNGVYLKGMEQNQAKPFEPLWLNYEKYSEIENYIKISTNFEQKHRLTDVLKLVQGFESTFALELLATVDFVSNEKRSNDIDEVQKAIAAWSDRKANLFENKQIEIAYNHLKNHSETIFEMNE
jgi:O-acetyl-ADP-ribose deacetylase (regulator of RNase III)